MAEVVKLFSCIPAFVGAHLPVTYRMSILYLSTVPAWTKVQNGVKLHDWQKSAAGAHLGWLNFTCMGNG